MKLTKQGVRDLSHLKGPEKKPREPLPKLREWCRHARIKHEPLSGDTSCLDCSLAWDWNGVAYDD